MSEPSLLFPPFCLDLVNACLWRGSKRLPLLPKDFAVLHYLATHAGRLVTQAELLKAVWADTIVSPSVLKLCLHRIRRALGDRPTAPRFIETVHGRGYRFIAPITTSPQPVPGFRFQVSGFRFTGRRRESTT